MDKWFTVDRIDEGTYIISEYRHWEETYCYLMNGSGRSLLIDTGLGICNIYDEVVKLTDQPVTAVATHDVGSYEMFQGRPSVVLHGTGLCVDGVDVCAESVGRDF